MRTICAVTANRADFSRIETILKTIEVHPNLKLQLVVIGSHLLDITGKTIEEIKRKGFTVDRTLYMEVSGSNPTTMTKSVGLAIIELSTIFDQLQPDIVLCPVDRFESLAIGVTAAMMNIHVAHTQGGEVTGTIDESIRHALTKMSHLHFVANEKSKERVIKMGESPNTVFNVGCPATDLLLKTPALNRSQTIKKINKEMIKTHVRLDPSQPYIFMIQHPVTTEYQSTGSQMHETLEALKVLNKQVILLWPNIDAGADKISGIIRRHPLMESSKTIILKNMPTELFVNVLRNTSCLVGNSSCGIRESCYFGTPTVNIGSRQNSREHGENVIDVPYKKDAIVRAIRKQIAHGVYPVEYIYGDGTAGQQFADICAVVKLPPIQKKITY